MPDSADVLTAFVIIFAFIMTAVATLHLWTEFFATLIIIGIVLGIIGAIVAACFIIRGVLHITRRIPEPRPRFERRNEPVFSSRAVIDQEPERRSQEMELRRRIEEEFDRNTEGSR